MAYCPKCGVEVDNYVRTCPLCDFPIPDIGEKDTASKRYPMAVNTYENDHQEKKNKIFYSLEIIAFCAFLITGVLLLLFGVHPKIFETLLLSEAAIILYLLFGFWYLPGWLNGIGFYGVTVGFGWGLCLILDSGTGWYFRFMLPVTSLFFLDLFFLAVLYSKNRHRNQFVYVPVSFIAFVIVLTLGIDGIISFQILGRIRFSWSLIVTISGICLIALLMGIYYGVPDKTKAYLKKKLHV